MLTEKYADFQKCQTILYVVWQTKEQYHDSAKLQKITWSLVNVDIKGFKIRAICSAIKDSQNNK